jgi:tRNA threonylcarbamoyladenosine biosynthesis protein TsaB
MNILAFDTCYDACSVAAGRGLRTLTPRIAALFEPMQTGQADRLMPMIEEALDETHMRIVDLDRIAITNGPGTFTGARITVAAARAFALSHNKPLVVYSSLSLMAMNPVLAASAGRRLAIATDARRDQVYVQLINRHTLKPDSDAMCIDLANAAQALGHKPIEIAGSGGAVLATTLREHGVDAVDAAFHLLPDAFDMLFAAGEAPLQKTVDPLYLRPPDAKPPSQISPWKAQERPGAA